MHPLEEVGTIQNHSIKEALAADRRALQEVKQFYWYHCIDLGDGVVTDGDYDLRPLVAHYGFPENMAGMSVLDVGRGSGFFSFEFEKRGAQVIATDIGSYFDWDFCGGREKKEEWKRSIGDEKEFSRQKIYGAFEAAKRIKGSKVESKFLNVYDICPEAFEGRVFDLVFVGSLLTHLRDPILALERLCSVTSGKLILAAAIMKLAQGEDIPLMSLVASPSANPKSWWIINRECLIAMLQCANFSNIEIISEFVIENRRVKGLSLPHVVVHATGSSP